ncbi:MAG: hypothetical protein E6Q67_05410 [Roseateles sp.]|nr:MAG: hypothetical protein E6Q67_05410 [Roseateles sp.]
MLRANLRSFGVLLTASLLLTACAVAPEDAAPQAEVKVVETQLAGAQSDVVCAFEAPTGSNRKVKRCMSREDYKKGMETAQRTAGEIRTPPPDVR